MNHILPLLPWLTMFAAAATSSGQGQGGPAANHEASQAALPQPGEVLATSRARLDGYAGIAAKIRQQVEIFDQRIVGAGAYLQHGTGPNLLVRMELRMQLAGAVSSMLQVGDGRYLWTERRFPDERFVSRIDVRRVRALRNKDHSDQDRSNQDRSNQDRRDESPEMPAMGQGQGGAIGGLGELLAGLDANFIFSRIEAGQMSGVPVYSLTGGWRPERVAEMLPSQQATIEAGKPPDLRKLPAHIPDHVMLVVGRDDFFPYVVDYRRQVGAGQGSSDDSPAIRSLVRMQLFEVRINGPVDMRQFVYRPGDVDVEDRTEKYLAR